MRKAYPGVEGASLPISFVAGLTGSDWSQVGRHRPGGPGVAQDCSRRER
jgi:hypothetical protein